MLAKLVSDDAFRITSVQRAASSSRPRKALAVASIEWAIGLQGIPHRPGSPFERFPEVPLHDADVGHPGQDQLAGVSLGFKRQRHCLELQIVGRRGWSPA